MNDLKDYVDLKVDELKLRTTQGLSVASSRVVSALLLVAMLIIVLSLISVVLISWLSVWTGSMPVACSIVCGVFVLALVILFLLRKRMFRDSFVRLFIKIFYGDGKE
jgi:hypothetical protein